MSPEGCEGDSLGNLDGGEGSTAFWAESHAVPRPGGNRANRPGDCRWFAWL